MRRVFWAFFFVFFLCIASGADTVIVGPNSGVVNLSGWAGQVDPLGPPDWAVSGGMWFASDWNFVFTSGPGTWGCTPFGDGTQCQDTFAKGGQITIDSDAYGVHLLGVLTGGTWVQEIDQHFLGDLSISFNANFEVLQDSAGRPFTGGGSLELYYSREPDHPTVPSTYAGFQYAAIPEPCSMALSATGLLATYISRKMRR